MGGNMGLVKIYFLLIFWTLCFGVGGWLAWSTPEKNLTSNGK